MNRVEAVLSGRVGALLGGREDLRARVCVYFRDVHSRGDDDRSIARTSDLAAALGPSCAPAPSCTSFRFDFSSTTEPAHSTEFWMTQPSPGCLTCEIKPTSALSGSLHDAGSNR